MEAWKTVALSFALAGVAFATDGYVTPTTVVITMTQVDLVSSGGMLQNVVPYGSRIPITFNAADHDFSSTSLSGSVSFPTGTFTGIQVCYLTSRSIKLDGVKYEGTTATSSDSQTFTDATSLLYTASTDASGSNSVTTSVPGGGATLASNYIVGSGTENCSTTQFPTPLCIGSGPGCLATPSITLLYDMAHSVGITVSNRSLDNHVASYPYAVLGTPGAAVHLSYSSGSGNYADISLLLDSSKNVIFATASALQSNIGGFCSGVPGVSATAAPAGVTLTPGSAALVIATDTASGHVQFATGNCGGGSACVSNGLLDLNNVFQAQGQTVSVTCSSDTTGALGYTYTGGSGSPGGPASFTVEKIVDPNNILGVCPSGSCGTYP